MRGKTGGALKIFYSNITCVAYALNRVDEKIKDIILLLLVLIN